MNSQEASTSWGSSLLKMQTDGPWLIIRGCSGSNWGTGRTAVSKETISEGSMSTSGASVPIQVEPAVESTANRHWPAFRKLAG